MQTVKHTVFKNKKESKKKYFFQQFFFVLNQLSIQYVSSIGYTRAALEISRGERN